MTNVVNILQYLFPVLVVSIAVVLLCFYLHAKKKRAAYDITLPTMQDDTSTVPIQTISSEHPSEHQEEVERFPPRYSTDDLPPPYALVREPRLQSLDHCTQFKHLPVIHKY
ncbi:hypothetical protein PAMA_012639 [Pampus argenteus]